MGGVGRRPITVDPEAGIVYGRRGGPCMCRDRWGYIRVFLGGGSQQQAHRIIWESVHGPIPDGHCIDHINGDVADNRIDNLRLCNQSQNQMNRHAIQGAVPLKGVCFNRAVGKYQASIKVDGKSIYLGLFANPDDAAAAYRSASLRYFGEFAAANNEGHE